MTGLRQFVNDLIAEGMALFSTSVAEHLTNAKKELLLAIRALVDEELKWSDVHLARARELKAKRYRARAAREKK